MVIKLNKKNPLSKDLYSKKYKPRVVKPKKARGVSIEKKSLSNKIFNSKNLFYIHIKTYNYSIFIRFIFCNFVR